MSHPEWGPRFAAASTDERCKMWTATEYLAWGIPGGMEWIIILAIALLIFGRKLPEVGRGLGKGLVEFKKGLKGVKEELDDVDSAVEDAVNREEPAQLEDKSSEVAEHSAEMVSEKSKA